MRAMVLTKNAPIEICPLTLEERLIPIPQKNEVFLRVEKMENSSSLFEKGDRVGLGWPYSTCGSCEFCF